MIRYAFILLLLLQGIAGCASSQGANSAGYVDAMEVKLKCRELADQMLATVPNDAIQGFVAVPTSFVDQNNTSQSSPLGKLFSETMFFEFNQRGFPTWEYRLSGNIAVTGGQGDLALASSQIVQARQKWGAMLVGTYAVDKDVTFVNARLVRASDGLVLRTGQVIMPNTPIVKRMITPDARVSKFHLPKGTKVSESDTLVGMHAQAGYPVLGNATYTLPKKRRGIPIRQGR